MKDEDVTLKHIFDSEAVPAERSYLPEWRPGIGVGHRADEVLRVSLFKEEDKDVRHVHGIGDSDKTLGWGFLQGVLNGFPKGFKESRSCLCGVNEKVAVEEREEKEAVTEYQAPEKGFGMFSQGGDSQGNEANDWQEEGIHPVHVHPGHDSKEHRNEEPGPQKEERVKLGPEGFFRSTWRIPKKRKGGLKRNRYP